jgi:hypothetical protein
LPRYSFLIEPSYYTLKSYRKADSCNRIGEIS